MSPASVPAAAFSVVRPGTLLGLLFSICAIGMSSRLSGFAAKSWRRAGLKMWLIMLLSDTNAPPAERNTLLNLWLNMNRSAFLEVALDDAALVELEHVGEAHGGARLLRLADPGEPEPLLVEDLEELLDVVMRRDRPYALCGVFARPLDELPEPALTKG
jgi:hypothetical protein